MDFFAKQEMLVIKLCTIAKKNAAVYAYSKAMFLKFIV